MKNIILSLILLTTIGCVHSEVGEEGPDKMKTSTVWRSDLKLNYDSVYDRERRKGQPVGEKEYEDYEIEEYTVTLGKIVEDEIEGPLEVAEVDSFEVDKLIADQVSLKIKNDELKTKAPVEVIEVEEEEKSGKVKWLLLLASFITLGGFYSSFTKKSNKKQ